MSTVALTLFLLACGAAEEAPAEAPAAEAPAAEAPAKEAEATNALQQADAMDGTEDKVVHKCAGCSLGMDGSAEHAVTVDGYELHFCSDSCKADFEKDPEAGKKRLEAAVN